MISLITGLITGGINLWSKKIDKNAEIAEAKHQRELRKLNGDIEWELQQAKNANDSWKDEFWTIVLAIPLFLVFFPKTRPWVEEGFKALEASVPDWYLMALGAAIGAAFGVKPIVTAITKKFK